MERGLKPYGFRPAFFAKGSLGGNAKNGAMVPQGFWVVFDTSKGG